jgi:hypothetical protein
MSSSGLFWGPALGIVRELEAELIRFTEGRMTETSRGIQDVVRRIRGEFLEMPGLRLTSDQARRLWRLDETACDAVLGALVDARFLAKTRDGAFIRYDGTSPY